MFRKPTRPSDDRPAPRERAAADIARIQGGGLVQIIITELVPLTYYLFLNDQMALQEEIESLSVSIDAPDEAQHNEGMIRATLTRFVKTVTGERGQQHDELFPCTLEIVALDRRICVTCPDPNSLNGVWVRLGLKTDGSGAEVTGLKSLRILLTEGILDAKITWEDGETEDLFPQNA